MGAAMPDRVVLVVGSGHTPGREGPAGRGGGQLAGQVRVDEADSVHLSGPLRAGLTPFLAAIMKGFPVTSQ